jgi:predicted ferric reductase
VNVDGPYGPALDYASYHRVILVAGGVGVTPCLSVYTWLHKAKHSQAAAVAAETVRLIWVRAIRNRSWGALKGWGARGVALILPVV